jgi:hypothetical protein
MRSFQSQNERIFNNIKGIIQEPDINFLHIFKKDWNALTYQSIFWKLNNPAAGFGSPLDFTLTKLRLISNHTSTAFRYYIGLQNGIPNASFDLPVYLMTACIPAGTFAANRTRDFGKRGINISRRESLILQTSNAAAFCTVAVIGKCERPYFAYEYQVNP